MEHAPSAAHGAESAAEKIARTPAGRVLKRFAADVGRDDVGGLAAELAYRFLFAIFPFGIFVAALSSFVAHAIGFSDPTSTILGSLGDNLPADIANMIRPQLEQVIGQTQPGLLTIGAVLALWAATGGTNAVIKGMNRAYEVEETRALIPRYALAIGLTVLAGLGLIVSFVTIVGASLLTTQLIQGLNLDPTLVSVVALLRWPAVFVLLSIAVGILYRVAPNASPPFRWCLAGGALFSLGWLVATAAFGFYVANFSNYANTYGALGGVIVLMLWFYISAFILIAAAALIAAYLKELRPSELAQATAEAHADAATRSTGGTDAKAGTRPADRRSPKPAANLSFANADRVRAGLPSFVADRQRADDWTAPVPRSRALVPTGPAATTSTFGIRRRRAAYPPPSPPEDWAFAGLVTGVGATIGILAAWLLRPRTRG
jgi:membrane protein